MGQCVVLSSQNSIIKFELTNLTSEQNTKRAILARRAGIMS